MTHGIMENYRACLRNNFTVLQMLIEVFYCLQNATVHNISKYKCVKATELVKYNKAVTLLIYYIDILSRKQ